MAHMFKSFYRYFMWILFSDKKGIVSNGVYKKRLSICEDCEHYFKPTMQCKICKCFMFMKAKVINTNCPIGKWKLDGWGQELNWENA